MKHAFIAGTDTDSGKTHTTCLLLAHLQQQGRSAIGFKPVCSGGRADAQALLTASTEGPTLDEINPCWCPTPLSPYTASLMENRPVDVPSLVARFHALSQQWDHVLVEGAGGWETPLSNGSTMADLAATLKLPVLLVVNNRLGALNHTLLTLRSIAAHGLPCCGILLNHPSEERDPASISNRSVLERFTSVPILGEIIHGATDLPDFTWPGLQI